MKRLALAVSLLLALSPRSATSFCGFYVARGDAKLFNHASQVVMARDGDRTVMTMTNDFQGEPKEFAIVIPVPIVLQKGQIHIGDRAQVEHLDAFSAPRLVEYFDEDPCQVALQEKAMTLGSAGAPAFAMDAMRRENSHGVTIEARYTVGEYDILILSARQSSGLQDWLVANGYRVPPAATPVLQSYIRQGLKFFVAKVNLAEQAKLGFSYLRPIQIAYESPRFMLPIRLGMANASGAQELFVYALTRNGRVETTNYRNVFLPANQDIPLYVKDRFPAFYQAMFAEQARKKGTQVVFTEHFWDMGWCDPCAAQPLSNDELKSLGVWWVDESGPGASGLAANTVFVTRLHVRYDRAHFPEDLVFQQTVDRNPFQARYVLRHEWQGSGECPGARAYRQGLPARRRQQAQNLAELTGWPIEKIRTQMGYGGAWGAATDSLAWWQRIWKG